MYIHGLIFCFDLVYMKNHESFHSDQPIFLLGDVLKSPKLDATQQKRYILPRQEGKLFASAKPPT